MLPTSRKEALASGAKRYFTGKPCKRGHVAERQTNNGTCVVCRPKLLVKFHKSNPGYATAFSNEYRKANPERAKKHAKDTYERHKKKILDRNRKWRGENRVKVSQQKKIYIANNPELIRSLRQNYRARKASAEGSHSGTDIQRIFAAQRGRCACCNSSLKKLGYHVDHIVPLSKGGANWPANLQLLCGKCNCKKYDRDAIDFMREEAGRLL